MNLRYVKAYRKADFRGYVRLEVLVSRRRWRGGRGRP
jgi:hypothetical protein